MSKTIEEFHPKINPIIYAKFFENIDLPITRTTCWLWKGEINKTGYGVSSAGFRYGSNHILAHRLAWKLFKGPITTGRFICHKCDIPHCVNPYHLFSGTHTDNMRDCASKGRLFMQKPKELRQSLTACKRGHKYSGKNIMVDGCGYKRCRRCAYDKNLVARLKRKSKIEEKVQS